MTKFRMCPVKWFQESEAKTITAMVNDGGITGDNNLYSCRCRTVRLS